MQSCAVQDRRVQGCSSALPSPWLPLFLGRVQAPAWPRPCSSRRCCPLPRHAVKGCCSGRRQHRIWSHAADPFLRLRRPCLSPRSCQLGPSWGSSRIYPGRDPCRRLTCRHIPLEPASNAVFVFGGGRLLTFPSTPQRLFPRDGPDKGWPQRWGHTVRRHRIAADMQTRQSR